MVYALLSTLYSLQPNSYELTQTQDFEVYQLTRTQAIKMTQDFQALQQTQLAQDIETATPYIDDFAYTATGRAKVTQEFQALQQTQSAQGIETATPDVDDFAKTATALIGMLTKDVMALTKTAVQINLTPTKTPTLVWR